jgi:hypothetical protein
LHIILRDTLALHVHSRERVLGLGESLLGGFAKPPHGLGVILRNASAPRVHAPKSFLSFGVTLVGKRTKEAKFGGVIAALVCGTSIIQ